MVFPWIPFLKERRKRLSDIEFLTIKEFGGKLVSNTGEQADGTTGNTATLTASGGKDLYLAKAQATFRVDAVTNLIQGEITLVANAVIKDRWIFSVSEKAGGSGLVTLAHDFAVKGIKVAATNHSFRCSIIRC